MTIEGGLPAVPGSPGFQVMFHARRERANHSEGTMVEQLSRNWGWIVARGVVAILFGLVVLLSGAASPVLLVLLFGAFALVDGIVMIVAAAADRQAAPVWVEMVLGGIFGVLVGIAALVSPLITGLVLLALIAVWAVIVGITEIVAAFRLRKVIEDEWALGLIGLASVAFGVIVLLRPLAGALAIALVIATFALLTGVLQIVFGVRLHNWGRRVHAAATTPLPA